MAAFVESWIGLDADFCARTWQGRIHEDRALSPRSILAPLLFGAICACVPGFQEDGGAQRKDRGLPEDQGMDGGAQDLAGADLGGLDLGDPMDLGVLDTGADLGPGPYDAGPVMDSDSDGIPDDEDPFPNRANTPLLVDPFDTEDNGWIFSSVSMRIVTNDGTLSVQNLEPFEREGWIGPRPAWGDYIIRALVRLNEVGNSQDTESGNVGILFRASQVTPSNYMSCGLDLKRNRVVLSLHEGTRRTVLSSETTSASVGDWLAISIVAQGSSVTCRLAGANLEANSPVFLSGSVGFRSFDATFDAEYMEVYDLL